MAVTDGEPAHRINVSRESELETALHSGTALGQVPDLHRATHI